MAVFRISGVWHVGWWNLITSVRLIQVGNNRNDHFQVLFRCLRPLNRGVRLIKVSITELNLETSATVRLIEGVRLIWCPLNIGFTVIKFDN